MCDSKLETLERDMKENVSKMKALESINAVRDTETKRANEVMEEMRLDQVAEIAKISQQIGSFEFKIQN